MPIYSSLSGDATEEELAFLRTLIFENKRPTPLYYYRALQSLTDLCIFVMRQHHARLDMVSQARADPLKITAVRRYFARKFPGWSITDRRGLDTILEFTIEGGPTGQVFTVKVTRNFLDDYKPEEIELKLEQWQVGDSVRVSGQWSILITSNGLQSMR